MADMTDEDLMKLLDVAADENGAAVLPFGGRSQYGDKIHYKIVNPTPSRSKYFYYMVKDGNLFVWDGEWKTYDSE